MNAHEQAQAAVHHSLRVAFDNEELEFGPTDRLQHDLGLDSMTFLHLALDLETFLQGPLGEQPDQLPQTVSDLVDLVTRRLEDRSHVA
jgi:acyl carrier protein